MPFASVNGIELCYETDGDPTDPPLLLIAGLGVQLIGIPAPFVDGLVAAGHFVIRFDNRDLGLSTSHDDAPSDPHAVLAALLNGDEPELAYTLDDLADDAAGLLAVLGIDAAHVVGISMGAMIAQLLAIRHRDRVRSLTSIMSTTGAADVGQPSDEAAAVLAAPSAAVGRAEVIEESVTNAQVWASPDHFDPANLRTMFADAWDRVGDAQSAGMGRQLGAILAAPARDEQLRELDVPSLVVHGTADKLIDASGGIRTAQCLQRSRHVQIEGMGHDLVPAFVPQIVALIAELTASA